MIRSMMMVVSVAAMAAVPARAEVVSSGPNQIHITHKVSVAAPPAALWARLGDIGSWWDGDHTYSGKATNLRLTLAPGGCFCEHWSGGGIEHMRVALVRPGKQIVMTGGLGPLLYEGVSGVLRIDVAPSGGGSVLTFDYRAAGFVAGNGATLAKPVDMVLGQQAQRLAKAAAGPR